jgi:SAM-dependent methyltransferase
MILNFLKSNRHFVKTYKLLRFSGRNRYCPVCHKSSSLFFDFSVPPVPPRPDAECPHCGSLERHRLIILLLQHDGILKKKNLNILHFAPEAFLADIFECNENGHNYISADLSRCDVKIRMDICDICFKSDYFDLIICNHVLEHVDDDHLALLELCRVLSPGGVLILTIPQDSDMPTTFEDKSVTSSSERERLFGQADHVRVYGADFVARLRNAALTVEEWRGSNFLTKEDIELMGITSSAGTIYTCTKPQSSP